MDHLEGQLREMYGRLAYTHKTHEKMADVCVARYKAIKMAEIVISAISTSSLIYALLGDSRAATIVGAGLSTVLLGFVLYFKEASLGERAQLHTEVAAKLWGQREKLLSVLIDARTGAPELDIKRQRDDINVGLEKLYRNAPRTTAKAYAAAQKALKLNEELYFSQSELDHLLPPDLRKDS